LQMSPRQVVDALPRLEPPVEPVPTPVTPIDDIHAPDLQAAIRADLDRELVAPPRVGSVGELQQMIDRGVPGGERGRAETEGRYPTSVDAAGNVSYQSIDKALNEVDSYKMAADQIAACASPAPEAEAA